LFDFDDIFTSSRFTGYLLSFPFYFVSKLALSKSNSACWSSTKRKSSSSHWKLTCSRLKTLSKVNSCLILMTFLPPHVLQGTCSHFRFILFGAPYFISGLVQVHVVRAFLLWFTFISMLLLLFLCFWIFKYSTLQTFSLEIIWRNFVLTVKRLSTEILNSSGKTNTNYLNPNVYICVKGKIQKHRNNNNNMDIKVNQRRKARTTWTCGLEYK
jgi:hypothetical protein